MREFHVASNVTTLPMNNIADAVFENARSRPDHVALRRRVDGTWRDVTDAAFATEVTALGRGLIAAGIDPGDRVAVMSKTRYEWTLIDFALLAIGAVVVPIYETSSAEQVEWILADSAAKAVFVETDDHVGIVESVRERTPGLAHLWQIDKGAIDSLGAEGAGVDAGEVTTRCSAVTLDDTASIIYTSGTTGRPKGCQLLHRSFVTEISEVVSGLEEFLNADTATLLFLPVAHVLGRVIQLGAIYAGCTLGHSPDVRNLVDDLGGFKPTFVLAVPRVFEKVYNTAKQTAHSTGKDKIFGLAERVAISYSEALDRGRVALPLKLAHAVFDKLVYSKLRAALGGKCVAAVSGGAPLGARLGHFFRGLGVTIYEGYGLTETTAAVCVNRPEALRIGTVGKPVGGVSARIDEDGELLIKSTLVFHSYWNNPEATREAIDAEGWFHTGDLGAIDDDGFVTITGRKKEIIITAAGKNVAPAVLEDRVRANWLVSQCLVVGDQKPFVAALITVDPESWPTWLERHQLPAGTKLESMVDDPALRADIQAAIDEANQAVSRAESIRKFSVLAHDWTEASGELTPSLKVKRNVVQQRAGDAIAALYTGAAES